MVNVRLCFHESASLYSESPVLLHLSPLTQTLTLSCHFH